VILVGDVCQEHGVAVNQKEIKKKRLKQLIKSSRVKLKENRTSAEKSLTKGDLKVGMVLFKNYSEEDQMNIMTTLNVIQTRGWSAKTDDQYQFHIMLGNHNRGNEERMKEIKNYCKKAMNESNQKLKDYKELKEMLRQEQLEVLEVFIH
jgi:hypothetical protein